MLHSQLNISSNNGVFNENVTTTKMYISWLSLNYVYFDGNNLNILTHFTLKTLFLMTTMEINFYAFYFLH